MFYEKIKKNHAGSRCRDVCCFAVVPVVLLLNTFGNFVSLSVSGQAANPRRYLVKVFAFTTFSDGGLSMSDASIKRKSKRVRIEYILCGNMFNDDFKRKHEEKLHNRKSIYKIHVGAAPEKPIQCAANTSKCIQMLQSVCTYAQFTSSTIIGVCFKSLIQKKKKKRFIE